MGSTKAKRSHMEHGSQEVYLLYGYSASHLEFWACGESHLEFHISVVSE